MADYDGEYARGAYVELVPHYYGDYIRQLFNIAAPLMLITAPFYANNLTIELPFEIVGALVLVALAALTNPHKQTIVVADAVAAGLGLLVYGTWALLTYDNSSWLQFILREVIALLFLTAFYFSMKTVRAFALHQIGKHDEAGEFDEESGAKQ